MALTIPNTITNGINANGNNLGANFDAIEAWAALVDADLAALGALSLLDTVGTAQIDDDAVTNAKIAVGAVGTTEIADDAVTNAKIGADAVTGAEIADDAIDSEHYVDGSIDAAHLASSSVTEDKIATDAVTALKIDTQVQDAYLSADQAVTTSEVTRLTETITCAVNSVAVISVYCDIQWADTVETACDTFVGTLYVNGTAQKGQIIVKPWKVDSGSNVRLPGCRTWTVALAALSSQAIEFKVTKTANNNTVTLKGDTDTDADTRMQMLIFNA